ncbi:MAG: hypothetical protein AAGI38_20900 [Bacteroidota bacterium]
MACTVMFWIGCDQDPCENEDCGFGTCIAVDDDAECRCDEGFEKDANGSCTIPAIDKFEGEYTASEVCTGDLIRDSSLVYDMTIAIFGSRLRVRNLGAWDCPSSSGTLDVFAEVDGNNFAIESGNYCDDPSVNGIIRLSDGFGSFEDSLILVRYKVIYEEGIQAFFNQTCEVRLRPK